MGKLRLGAEGPPAVWVESQKDVSSSAACPRQGLGWVWGGWGREQRMGALQKDVVRRAAQHPKSGSLPGDPTSQTAPAPGRWACLPPMLWSPLLRKRLPGCLLGQPWDTAQQLPRLFVRVSGPGVSLWASLARWRPCPLSGPTMKTPEGQAATTPLTPSCPILARSAASFSTAFASVNRA